jgi:hypothetical protein
MEIIEIDGDVAEIETDYGVYWISFDINEDGRVANASVVNFSPIDGKNELPPSDELIISEAIALIDDEIGEVKDGVGESLGQDQVCLFVVRGKNKLCSVKLEEDLTESDTKLFLLLNGNPKVVRALRKPLSSIVASYYKSSKTPDDEYLQSLLERLLREVSRLWSESDDVTDLSRANQISVIEHQAAALGASVTLLNCADALLNVILKGLIREGAEPTFYKMRVQRTSRFNTERFRAEHPDLYQKYLTSSETEVLSRPMTAKTFPFDEIKLREQFDKAFSLIGVIHRTV